MGGRTGTARIGVLAVALALVASACALVRPVDEAVDGVVFSTPRYERPGPYEVGVTTISLGDRAAEVWYPTTRHAVRGAERDVYFIRDFTSPLVQGLLPAELDPPFETDAYRDVQAFPWGRFPVVLFSHGALSYRLQSTFLTTHLASWGFVVASPDFLERGLQTFLGESPEEPKSSVEVLEATVGALEEEHHRPGGLLAHRLDLDTVLPVGHSAGGGASAALVDASPATDAWSSLAAGATGPAATDAAGLWMAGENDQVAPRAGVEAAYDAAPGPKRLVVIGGVGHNNAFTDICEIGEEGGGLVALAIEAGLPVPPGLAALGRDGCLEPNLDSIEVWPVVRHFVTAHLRFQAGLSPVPWGLDDGVADRFEVPVAYEQAGATT